MFVTAVCFLLLLKLKWPKNKNIYDGKVYMGLQGYTRVYRGYTRVYKGLQYTCQLFLRYKREIFILGVLGFLKTVRSFPQIHEKV